MARFARALSLGNGLTFCAIELRNSVAFELRDERSGKTAVVAPTVGELNNALRDAISGADVVLFDGTFWSNDELRGVRPNARSAREMNHFPISDGSLEFLRDSGARRKIYMHINNTNPILMPGSAEREATSEPGSRSHTTDWKWCYDRRFPGSRIVCRAIPRDRPARLP